MTPEQTEKMKITKEWFSNLMDEDLESDELKFTGYVLEPLDKCYRDFRAALVEQSPASVRLATKEAVRLANLLVLCADRLVRTKEW